MQTDFFFKLFPNCKSEQSDDDEPNKRFNPYQFIGGVCSYYHFSYDFVFREISFQNLLMLSASVPKYKFEKDKKKKPQTLTEILKKHGK